MRGTGYAIGEILIFLAIAAIIGFLIGWLVFYRRPSQSGTQLATVNPNHVKRLEERSRTVDSRLGGIEKRASALLETLSKTPAPSGKAAVPVAAAAGTAAAEVRDKTDDTKAAASDVKDKTGDTAQKAAAEAKDKTDDAKTAASDVKDKTGDTAQKAAAEARDKTDDAKAAASEVKDKADAAAEKAPAQAAAKTADAKAAVADVKDKTEGEVDGYLSEADDRISKLEETLDKLSEKLAEFEDD